MKLASLLAVTVALLLAGCGGDEESTMTDTLTVPPATSIKDLSVYWLRDGKVWPARRWVDATEATAQAALGALLAGPTDEEASADPAFTTAIPEGTEIVDVIVKDGAATVELSAELPDEALAQVTYTVLSQFLTVDSLEIQGRNLTRGGFESLTPAILVESPLSFEEVSSPLRVTGTANTFEANFSYELTDTDGLIIAEDFVTATSGTGTRGTFEFTVPFEVKFDGVGALIVFEPSAKDGSRTNLVEIPIRMKR